jgi:hypothetical protein
MHLLSWLRPLAGRLNRPRTRDGTWTLTCTVKLASGSYTLLALATDTTGAVSDPLTLQLNVI